MKQRLTMAVIVLPAACALWMLFLPKPWVTAPANTETTQTAPADKSSALAGSQPSSGAGSKVATVRARQIHGFTSPARNLARAGAPMPLEFTNFSVRIVLQNVRHAIRDYASVFGGNPVGSNREITRALAGRNPKHVNFLNADAGLRVNAAGRLVDPWGTPYFFHQLSGTEMEIHTAGPDRIMWTQDDLVIK